MSPNRRIFLNIVATYGRSLYSLVVGLFCGRWALQALGEVDYGLLGLVGGLVGFVAFINSLLSMGVMRFYAVCQGAAKTANSHAAGLEECRKWFNTAITLHSAVPIVLVAIGYPLGAWAIEQVLTIPADRVSHCIWIWRFTCISCFVGMASVPFSAMYEAKQEIAELTIYGFTVTTLNAMVLYYMINHPDVWIVKYAFAQCLFAVVPSLLILALAFRNYQECRFNAKYLWSPYRMKQIMVFSASRFFGAFANLTAVQGRSILVNKFMGPVFNASMGIGNVVASHATTLSSSISGAFWPAIANKSGEGDVKVVTQYMFRTCRLGTLMIAVFAVPLLLEAKEVLRLWLKNPPPETAEITMAILLAMLLQRMSEGYWMAIMGIGRRVVHYSIIVGSAEFVGLGVCAAMFFAGCRMRSVEVGLIVASVLISLLRACQGRAILGISIRHWLCRVVLPVFGLVMAGIVVGLPSCVFLRPSFLRICMTTACCEMAMVLLGWFLVLDDGERKIVKDKIAIIKAKLVS